MTCKVCSKCPHCGVKPGKRNEDGDFTCEKCGAFVYGCAEFSREQMTGGYETFSEEWKVEMMKWPKKDLVKLLSKWGKMLESEG